MTTGSRPFLSSAASIAASAATRASCSCLSFAGERVTLAFSAVGTRPALDFGGRSLTPADPLGAAADFATFPPAFPAGLALPLALPTNFLLAEAPAAFAPAGLAPALAGALVPPLRDTGSRTGPREFAEELVFLGFKLRPCYQSRRDREPRFRPDQPFPERCLRL